MFTLEKIVARASPGRLSEQNCADASLDERSFSSAGYQAVLDGKMNHGMFMILLHLPLPGQPDRRMLASVRKGILNQKK
jgi:hypothetical protein